MAGLVDRFGVPVISTGNEFGDEQIGYAIRSGLLFGVQNSTFDYTPPDPTAEIQNSSNPLPFWQIDNASNGADGLPQIAGSAIFDSTTGTWGVNINPGTAAAGATYTLRTRSFVLNDDNLQLRQKAFATLAKVGTYAGSSQWNCVLRAIYWAHNGSAISTATIGTVYDNTTWTGISGFTTTSGTAFPSSADSVDLEFIFTTTATVSSSTSLTIKSLLLTTSSATSGSFIVTETFSSSGTWTRPAGVTNLTAVVGIGGGGGGAGGGLMAGGLNIAGTVTTPNATGGGSSSWAILRDIYVGDINTVTVGIGTAGVGGSSVSFSKAAGATGSAVTANIAGGAGGVTSFGTYMTIPGGGGGLTSSSGGTAGGAPTSSVYGFANIASVAGASTVGGSSLAGAYSALPYFPTTANLPGAAGGSASRTISGGSATLGTPFAASAAGIIAGGGGGQNVRYISLGGSVVSFPNGGIGGAGGAGSGGAGVGGYLTATGTVSFTAGAGGSAGANTGSGGGGGGAALQSTTQSNGITIYNASTVSLVSGKGGDGAAGAIYVVYVA